MDRNIKMRDLYASYPQKKFSQMSIRNFMKQSSTEAVPFTPIDIIHTNRKPESKEKHSKPPRDNKILHNITGISMIAEEVQDNEINMNSKYESTKENNIFESMFASQSSYPSNSDQNLNFFSQQYSEHLYESFPDDCSTISEIGCHNRGQGFMGNSISTPILFFE